MTITDAPNRGEGRYPGLRKRTSYWLALFMLAGALGLSGEGRPQGPNTDPVERLRAALQATYPDASARDLAVKQCLPRIHALSQLQRAATLAEWRESIFDDAVAAVDRANQAEVIERLRVAVRQMLCASDPAEVAEGIERIADMAALAHANGEPATLAGCFGPELANILVQGPLFLRPSAARVLGQIEPSAFVAMPALEDLLRADAPELRQAAADALADLVQNAVRATRGQRPSLRGELVLMAASVLPAVHHGLSDERPEIRRRCLETIGLACAALSRLIEDIGSTRPAEAERDELRPLVLALRDQGPILARSLRDSDTEARVLANKAFEELGHARECWVRHFVAEGRPEEAMLREAMEPAVPGLAEELAHLDVRVRRSALDALEMFGASALPALPALMGALHDRDRFVRWSAVRIVGKLNLPDPRATVTDLTRLLADPDLDLRRAAATALTRLSAQKEKPISRR